MQIVIDVMNDGMATVTVDGGEPLGPMSGAEAMDAVSGMMPAADEEAMFQEEAAKMEAPASDDMMEKM